MVYNDHKEGKHDSPSSEFHPLSKEPKDFFDCRSAPSHAESDAKKIVVMTQKLIVHCDRLLMRDVPSSIVVDCIGSLVDRASYLPEAPVER